MKVLVDARSLASGRGVARYTRRMLEGAAAGDDQAAAWHAVLPAGGPAKPGLPAHMVVHRSRLPSRALFGFGAAVGRPRLDVIGRGADVVWLPTVAPVAVSAGVPVALTVHDLSFLRRPDDFTAYERAWHRAARVDRLVARAAAVVCDTHAVAAEVRAQWPEARDRVRVVVPGVDPAPAQVPAALPAGVPHRFVLFVGALEPRKAPEVLAAAFAQARRDGMDAALVVVGTGRLDTALHGAGIYRLGTVDDTTLHALYARALALVMPSRLEGFGLPPLEAALHGTPSIVSDLPVFVETLGDGAVRVPAGDADALAGALRTVVADGALRTRLAAAATAAATP
ncbi:MAG: glycosyltransferase family 4 protein, partial [Solirubrobacterales bacterium]|nr:glycosyltransferase family 4 protein [Solirubrobacterales bacterium]